MLMRTGAIILCGGKSSRMGRDKATLPFGPELILQRMVRLVSKIVDAKNVVVVAAPKQSVPELPPEVMVVHDQQEFRGPLQGLATGFSATGERFDAVYATACDVPLLVPAFVERMFQLLGDYEIAVPFDGKHHHSLAAVYRPRVLTKIEALLAADRLRPRFLLDEVRTREVPVDELRDVDPRLDTLKNLNRYEDYVAALAEAGFGTPVEYPESGEAGGRGL
jgi:molybdopterin-guanine dinucleotide biosynthesis protein A